MNNSNEIDLICSVSSNGDCVAICTSDGVIKFYDTLTSNLKLEYTSSSHLQAACTCLSWSKLKRNSSISSNKQKKLKTNQNIETELNDLDLIAIGTAEGTTLLFSLSKATLHSQLADESGHTDKVNDVAWCSLFNDTLYSCSDDGHIIEWSFIDSKLKNKWKASKTSITSISTDSTSKYLISSSKTITIWDLNQKSKLKTLTGHSNDIFKLAFLNKTSSLTHYFISAARNDRILNAWKFDEKNLANDSSTALAAFNINEGAVYLDVLNLSDSNALVLAITNKGHLYVYLHQLESNTNNSTNKLKKPIKALNQLKLETNESNPIHILGSFVANKQNERLDRIDLQTKSIDYSNLKLAELLSQYYLIIIYGSQLNPKIEKLKFSDLTEAKLTLKRDDPYKTSVTLQTESTKIETPNISKDLKVLAPGFMHPQTNNLITNNTNSTKRKSIEPSQMSLEERLNIMGIDSNTNTTNGDLNGDIYTKNTSGQIPKTDNLVVLLVQGLQSNDAKMLNHVLQHKNEKLVSKTIRLLPTNHIISLVKELNKRLQGHAQSGMGIIKWLKCVLMIHTSYLMSYPDLIQSLGSVYEMMNARTKLFPQLSKLQGKLQLVMSQVSSQAEALQTANEKDIQPILYYQDSASEDEQIEDELIPSHSEFDDYNFSDEEDDDDENEEPEDDDDENGNINMTEDVIKKEVVSFKKKKAFNASKKNKDSDEDSDEDEDEDENDMNHLKNKNNEDDDDDDDDEDDDEDDEDEDEDDE